MIIVIQLSFIDLNRRLIQNTKICIPLFNRLLFSFIFKIWVDTFNINDYCHLDLNRRVIQNTKIYISLFNRLLFSFLFKIWLDTFNINDYCHSALFHCCFLSSNAKKKNYTYSTIYTDKQTEIRISTIDLLFHLFDQVQQHKE